MHSVRCWLLQHFIKAQGLSAVITVYEKRMLIVL
jgi:hypothetical protein